MRKFGRAGPIHCTLSIPLTQSLLRRLQSTVSACMYVVGSTNDGKYIWKTLHYSTVQWYLPGYVPLVVDLSCFIEVPLLLARCSLLVGQGRKKKLPRGLCLFVSCHGARSYAVRCARRVRRARDARAQPCRRANSQGRAVHDAETNPARQKKRRACRLAGVPIRAVHTTCRWRQDVLAGSNSLKTRAGQRRGLSSAGNATGNEHIAPAEQEAGDVESTAENAEVEGGVAETAVLARERVWRGAWKAGCALHACGTNDANACPAGYCTAKS